MGEERRAASRVQLYLPVRVAKAGYAQPIETLTKDLGIGGLRCLSSTVLPVTTPVDVELVLSGGQDAVTIRGRIAWFRTIPESEQFEVGISFLETSPQIKRRLSMYLDRLTHSAVSSETPSTP
ncbi:MAG: PilZ domain-containing protein [Candidatus Omnitrophica bacterium]|nr:PilZ domain-containing protein [Candidatus Omnitrophota bacterium]